MKDNLNKRIDDVDLKLLTDGEQELLKNLKEESFIYVEAMTSAQTTMESFKINEELDIFVQFDAKFEMKIESKIQDDIDALKSGMNEIHD